MLTERFDRGLVVRLRERSAHPEDHQLARSTSSWIGVGCYMRPSPLSLKPPMREPPLAERVPRVATAPVLGPLRARGEHPSSQLCKGLQQVRGVYNGTYQMYVPRQSAEKYWSI